MSKRSTLLIVIGVAVFVLGAGLVVVSLHAGNGRSTTQARDTAAYGSTSEVVVTTGPVAAGTTGESLIESKGVTLEAVSGRQFSPNDVTSLSILEQESVVHPLAAGTPIQTSDLSVDAGPLSPPKGDESLALTFSSSASGLAGYLQPGDHVDVYANVIKDTSKPGAAALPCVALVAPKVEVLDVSDVVPAYRTNPSGGGRQSPGSITVLVAVTPAQAPAMVFYTSNEQLYLVASDQADVAPTDICAGLVSGSALVPVQ